MAEETEEQPGRRFWMDEDELVYATSKATVYSGSIQSRVIHLN